MVFSVFLNVVLVAVVRYLIAHRQSSPTEVVQGAAIDPGHVTEPIEHSTTNLMVFGWEMVESADYRNYIANLRAIGCPEETIRDIITADVNKLFEQRARELLGPPVAFEYWKPSWASAAQEAEALQKRIRLAREKRALLKELLGVEVADHSLLVEAFTPLKSKYNFLPAEKQQQLLELDAAYATKMLETFGKVPSASNDPRYAALMAQKQAELAQLLINVRDQMKTSFAQLLGSDGAAAYLKRRSGWMSVFPVRNPAQ